MAAKRLLTIGLCIAALALGGCGDDDGNGDRDSGPIPDGGVDSSVGEDGDVGDGDVEGDGGEQRITLMGTVYEQNTGGGGFGPAVSGVTVRMLTDGFEEVDSATTNSSGEYTIEAIANRTHFLHVQGNNTLWGLIRGERARGGNGNADPAVLQRAADFVEVGESLNPDVVPDEETGWISLGFAPADNPSLEYAEDPVRMYDDGDVGARLSSGPQPVIVNLTGPNLAEESETLIELPECDTKDIETCEENSLNRSEQIYMLNVEEDTDPGVTFQLIEGGLSCTVRYSPEADPVRQGTITAWPVMARTLTSVSVDCAE